MYFKLVVEDEKKQIYLWQLNLIINYCVVNNNRKFGEKMKIAFAFVFLEEKRGDGNNHKSPLAPVGFFSMHSFILWLGLVF